MGNFSIIGEICPWFQSERAKSSRVEGKCGMKIRHEYTFGILQRKFLPLGHSFGEPKVASLEVLSRGNIKGKIKLASMSRKTSLVSYVVELAAAGTGQRCH